MDRLIEQASRYLREHRAYRRYLSVFLCLALAIAGGTVALLTRPGIAMTVTATVLQCPYVGVAAHTHNDDCCDESGALVCPLPERALHQHSDACYTETRVLICTREETPGHIHTEACFTRVRGELLCENTDEEHVHDDSCYAWDNVLTCGFAEGEGTYTHGEDCYETVRTLTCGQEEILEEHIHGPGCFIEIVIEEPDPTAEPTVEPTAEPEPTAAPTAEPETTSEPEPTVEPGPQGDPTADVEEYWQWAAMVRDLDLTGDWNEDLIKVARTQLGYTESQFNFIEENGQYRSYTRCGAWYGLPYGEWCAMFVSFCLNFAGIPTDAMPVECSTIRWENALRAGGLFAEAASGYIPKTGDLVFFGAESDSGWRFAGHVGIVESVYENGGTWIRTIEGNHTPTVGEFDYSLNDSWIYGYGVLPEEPQPEAVPAVEEPAAEPEPEEELGTDGWYVLHEDEIEEIGELEESGETEETDGAGTPEEETSSEDERLSVSVSATSVQDDVLTYTLRLSSKTGTDQWTRLTSVMTGACFDRDLRITDENGEPVAVKDGLVSQGDKQFSFAFGTMYPGKEITVAYQARLTEPGVVEPVNTVTATCTFDGDRLSVEDVHRMPMEEPAEELIEELTEEPTEEPEELPEDGQAESTEKESVDLGLAVIEAANGEALPVEAEGHAYVLQGEEAESALSTVDAFLTAPVLTSPIKAKAAGAMRMQTAALAAVEAAEAESDTAAADEAESDEEEPDTVSETRYEVFEIGLDNVEESAFEGGFRVSVTLPEALTGRDFALYHIGADGVEELSAEYDSTRNEDGTETVTAFRFVTDSFSPFVLRYTVDFHYGELAYTLEGEGELCLSALLEALGIEGKAADVTACVFSDPALLETIYSETEGDWLLKSLMAFDTEETLTITFADGREVSVRVTDAQIRRSVLSADGEAYEITVTYGEDTGIPEDADLEVSEVTEGCSAYGRDYGEYVTDTENVLGMEAGGAGYIRLFDIKIVKDGEKVQPAEGTRVEVKIELAGAESDGLGVVHFADGAERGEVIESQTESDVEASVVEFTTDGFSVYAVVELDSAETAASVEALDGNSYYVSVDSGNHRYYFTNDLITTATTSKIGKTTTLDSASHFTFEAAAADDQRNNFYIYTYDDDGNKKYVNLNLEKFSLEDFDEETTTKYTVAIHTEGSPETFHIYHRIDAKNYYAWHLSGDFQGKKNNKGNDNKIILTKIGADESSPADPYGLDGQSLGVLWNVNNVSGSGMLASTGTADSNITLSDGSGKVKEKINILKNKSATVRIDPIGRTDRVFVAQNSDIAMWTFTCCGPAQYYMTTVVNGNLKYLRFDDSQNVGTGDKGVSLVDLPDERCKITVTEGTGTYTGKYKLSSNGRTLYNNNGNFFTKAETENGQNVWMYFTERSDLNDDDFVVYTAKKVSVSGTLDELGQLDYDVENGDQVVLYTRVWNEETLEYEYYIVDYDGMLVKAYVSGDKISWVGTKVNTMLWDFTEYHYLDDYGNETDVPNYYYELQNNYSGKYIVPQVSDEGFLADSPIGINLNGRRNNGYYSTILAWDDPYYDYASLMIRDHQLVSAPMFKAEDFYFAVMEPQTEETYLSTVATVDSEPFGITLKMQNYGNVVDKRSQEQTDVLKELAYNQWSGVKNLLTRYIAEGEAYPVSTRTGRSLAELYSNALTVNHQFLLSTYQETGYFEYDSTQNFAHLITSESDPWCGVASPNGTPYGVGDFVIYSQIASTTEQTGDTRRHGQFFPYNDLVENAIITNMVNDTDIHGNPLPSLDPSKGEKLYKLQFKDQENEDPQYVDFFFGMEMDASFMQSESGLDAWGHDLIFEFSGDDDFWLYIDDVLVLDLGGIHSALDGSVNFRTGVVIEQKGQGSYETTTLRARFETAYKAQYPDKTQAEVNDWLNGIFKDDGTNTGTVFKDYSGHTMKMFYMERGAGASNLHMRFNLAPYIDGEVQLEKEVSGSDTVSEEFPFQIWYEEPNGHAMVQAGRSTEYDPSVLDAKTREPIRYQENHATADGVTYNKVYFLSPGQTASVQLPSETTQYYFVECGIDPATYDRVTANKEELTGTEAGGTSARLDYSIEQDTVSGRKKVIYNNHVSDDALKTLTVTKRLWREFDKTTEILSGEGPDADNTKFRFRVYIGAGTDKTVDGIDYAVYNTGKYYVLDPEGNYCIWQNGGFVSTGINDFSLLSTEKARPEDKSQAEQATFYSSPSGAIDNIKAGYRIEIPGLMAGMPYYIEERAAETPAGYNLIGYTTTEGVYSATNTGTDGNAGVVSEEDRNRTVSVHNQHGYGMVVHKIWSDAAFMDSHDAIYFGVYLDGTLVEGSVRRLRHPATALTWFYPELVDGKTLNDYQVYELELTVPESGSLTVDLATGAVSGYSSVTKKGQDDCSPCRRRTHDAAKEKNRIRKTPPLCSDGVFVNQ